jgi:hypothetical protein
MSAFNPLPDQLQQDSGSPAVDVMAPPDQSQPPAAASTPNYPPSPDQPGGSAPVAQAQQDPDASSNTHGWRAVLRGALQGLEFHLKGAGEGLITGGIPGAVVGAVSPGMADNALKTQQALTQARVQQQQAAARSAMTDANFRAQDDPVQLAMAQTHLQQLQQQFANTPPDFQETLRREGAQAGQQLKDTGINPTFTGDEEDAQAHVKALMSINSDAPLNVIALPTGKPGQMDVFEIPSDQKFFNHDVTLTVGHDSNNQPITKTYAAGTISISRALNLETAALVDQGKVQGKIQLANSTGVTQKNQASANKANAAASAAPKIDNFLIGSLPDGTQVAGTQQDLAAAGVKGVTKLPAAEASKVVVARELTAPNGLFSSVAADLAALNAKGALNVATSRWNEFMTGKVGAGDPLYTKLRTDTQLLSTAIMQAHVGSRGSESMLDHFKGLADAGKMDAPTLTAALQAEFHYVRGKALLLPKKAGQ